MKENINDKDVREAIASIQEIKKTLRNSIQFLRPLLYDKRFAGFCLVCAAYFGLFFVIMHFAVVRWERFSLMPLAVQIGFCVLGMIAVIGSGFYKYRIFSVVLKKNNSMFSVESLLSEPELRQLFVDALLLFVAVIAAAVILGLKIGSLYVLAPLLFLYTASQCFHYAQLFYLRLYRIMGLVMCAAALLTALFLNSNPLLWIGGSFCVSFIIFGLSIYIEGSRS